MMRIRNFHDDGVGAWEENRRMHSEDLNFIYNAEAQGQWDPVVLQNRRGKPCYTFNRCLQPVNMVVADMRQTRASGKVRPASEGAAEAVADVFAGLCRSIEQCSRADQIYKEQFKFAVAGGFGAWRIMPTYMQDDGEGAFDQVLRVINISNPQTVVWDPQCADACAGDANRCIVAERISDDVYDQLYTTGENPVGHRSSFNMSRDSYGWFTDKEVRIAEYFVRLVDLLKSLFRCLFILGNIRMVLPSQFAERLFNLVLAGLPRDTKSLIIVFKLNRHAGLN